MKKIDNDRKIPETNTSMKDYAFSLWQKKFYIIIPVIVSAFIAFTGVRFLASIYISHSVIRMQSSEFLSREVTKMVSDQGRQYQKDQETLAHIRAEIFSSEFLDEVIAVYDLDKIPSLLREATVERESKYQHMSTDDITHRILWKILRKKIAVDISGPGMFKISTEDTDPQVCSNLTKTVTELFIDNQEAKQLRGLQEASEFSDEQLAIYKEQVNKSEKELLRIKTALTQRKFTVNPITEQNIRDAESLLKQAGMAVEERKGISDKIRGNVLRIVGYVPSSEDIWGDSGLSELENKLANARETELINELSAKKDAANAGTNINQTQNYNQIIETENDIQRYLTTLVQKTYPNVTMERRSLFVEYFLQLAVLHSVKHKKSRLNSYIQSFRRNLSLIPQMENEEAKIQKELESNREIYNTFLKAKTSAQISEAVEGMNLGFTIEIIENAKEPLNPDKPKKTKLLMMALMFGLIVGIVFLGISEYWDTSIRRVEDVEKLLDLRVLGVIPAFDAKSGWQRISKKRLIVWSSIIAMVVILTMSGFYYYGKSVKQSALKLNILQGDKVGIND